MTPSAAKTRTRRAPRTSNDVKRAVLSGFVAGVVGGGALWIALLLERAENASGLWIPFKLAAFPFFHARVLEPGFDAWPFVVGVIVHIAIAGFWGVIFGLACSGLNKRWTIATGVGFGVAVWFVMFYVALPLVGAPRAMSREPTWLAIFNHLIFGVAVSIAFLPYQTGMRRAVMRPAPTAT